MSSKYYDPYDTWIRVGWALKNTSDKLFSTWMLFSSQSSDFDYTQIAEYYTMWKGFDAKDDGLTNRSIMYWVRESNMNKYKDIREKTID